MAGRSSLRGGDSLTRMRFTEELESIRKSIDRLASCHDAVVAEMDLQLELAAEHGVEHIRRGSRLSKTSLDGSGEVVQLPRAADRASIQAYEQQIVRANENRQSTIGSQDRTSDRNSKLMLEDADRGQTQQLPNAPAEDMEAKPEEDKIPKLQLPKPAAVQEDPEDMEAKPEEEKIPKLQLPKPAAAFQEEPVADNISEIAEEDGGDTFEAAEEKESETDGETKFPLANIRGRGVQFKASAIEGRRDTAQRGVRISILPGMSDGGRSSNQRAAAAFIRDSRVAELQPWEFWEDIAAISAFAQQSGIRRSQTKTSMMKKGTTRNFKKMMSMHNFAHDDHEHLMIRLLQMCTQRPDSPYRLSWIVIGFLLICLDLVLVPLAAFEDTLDITRLDDVMTVVSTVFWSMDFFLSFLVGYSVGDSVETRPEKTAKNYAQGWMLIDICMVAVDYLQIAMLSNDDTSAIGRAARGGRMARYLRTIRLIRVFRLVKVRVFLKSLSFLSHLLGRSEYVTLSLSILQHILIIVMINHMFACSFYYIGKSGNGWVTATFEDPANTPWEYAYLTSLHWSLTQFTPASVNIHPKTLPERLFAVAVVLFAMITFSSFVSSITNLMTHMRSLRSVEAKMFSKLEHFLQHHSVSFMTSMRVRRYLERTVKQQRSCPVERDVELLGKLSMPLLIELHAEIYSPVLTAHPFLHDYQQLNLPALQKICHTAVKEVSFSKGDVVFSNGDSAAYVHFPVKGLLEYKGEAVHGGSHEIESSGTWVAEMSLWCYWNYKGILISKTEATLMQLDSAGFHHVVLHSKAGQHEAAAWAVSAVREMNEIDRSFWTDIDPLLVV